MKDYQLKFSETNFNATKQWVEFADKKASFILTITLAIFSASLIVAPLLVKDILNLIKGPKASLIILGAFLLILSFFYIFAFLKGVHHLFSVVAPRLSPHSKRKSVLFFQTIASMEIQEFKDKISKFSDKDIIDELLDQTYNNSVVAEKKFEKIRKAIFWIKLAGLSGLLLILISVIQQSC